MPLPSTQLPMQLSTELLGGSRTTSARSIGLHIMVQQLHRVQLRAVAGQKMQLDLLGMAPHPGADQLGPVHPMAIHDQMDLPASAIAQQPTRKSTKTRPVNDPVKRRNRSIPALETALIMVTRNRLPVPLITGSGPPAPRSVPPPHPSGSPSHPATTPARLRGGPGRGWRDSRWSASGAPRPGSAPGPGAGAAGG
jgi:hypothetical protein